MVCAAWKGHVSRRYVHDSRLYYTHPGWILDISLVAVLRAQGRLGGLIALRYEGVNTTERVRAPHLQPHFCVQGVGKEVWNLYWAV